MRAPRPAPSRSRCRCPVPQGDDPSRPNPPQEPRPVPRSSGTLPASLRLPRPPPLPPAGPASSARPQASLPPGPEPRGPSPAPRRLRSPPASPATPSGPTPTPPPRGGRRGCPLGRARPGPRRPGRGPGEAARRRLNQSPRVGGLQPTVASVDTAKGVPSPPAGSAQLRGSPRTPEFGVLENTPQRQPLPLRRREPSPSPSLPSARAAALWGSAARSPRPVGPPSPRGAGGAGGAFPRREPAGRLRARPGRAGRLRAAPAPVLPPRGPPLPSRLAARLLKDLGGFPGQRDRPLEVCVGQS